jgi:hypothetical protein
MGWILAVVGLVAACSGPATVPSAPATAVPSAAPAASTVPGASADPFAGKPYSLTLPDGWQVFDLSNPAGQAAIDAFTKVNPGFAAGIQSFLKTPNILLAVNVLLGDALVILPLGSQGLSLAQIGQSFTAQFGAIPGLASSPPAEPTTLPGGDALHWDLSLTVNKAGGGTETPSESIYLLVNGATAVLVEFVTPAGGVSPQESSIIQSFAFRP